ncbi:MAG: hypothetical protein EHM23_15805 [Acidobacteria bacterium]|nr:MAG: hypothetical protein EHM23_15805 [Acidobacteriota bacterium]
MKLKWFLLLCAIVLTGDLSAGERVLYAIRYESLERYPDIVNTKIYSLTPDGKESRLVFTDENASILSILLLARRGMPGHPGEVIASSRNKVFAHAVQKRLDPGRWYSEKASIYELSADGSNRFKKILNVQGEQSLSEIFVNPQGTKVGYLNWVDQRIFVFIHDTETGRLLNRIDLSKTFLDCFASTVGWLGDGERIFFTLETGDVHVTSEASYKQTGTYFLKADGTGLTRLPEKVTLPVIEKGTWRGTDGPPRFLGALPDGSYLFRDIVLKQGDRWDTGLPSVLYLVNPLTQSRKQIPIGATRGVNWFKISPTGKYIAFTEKVRSKEGYEWGEHLSISEVASEKTVRVFTLNDVPFKGRYLGLIGWIEDQSQ